MKEKKETTMTNKADGNDTRSVTDRLSTLRDEIRLHLHLASLDVRKEWDETLEPKVLEAERAARDIAEKPQAAVSDLVERLERFVARLRGGGASGSPA
jgi:hypothetical protein